MFVWTCQRVGPAPAARRRSLFPEAAPATASVRTGAGRAGDRARGCRAGAPLVMAEEAKAAADTPPPPPDKEDGEARRRNRPMNLHAVEQT